MILQFSYYKKSKFKLIYYIINIHFRYIIYTKKKTQYFCISLRSITPDMDLGNNNKSLFKIISPVNFEQ